MATASSPYFVVQWSLNSSHAWITVRTGKIDPSLCWSCAKSFGHDVHGGQDYHPNLALDPRGQSIGRVCRSVELITVCRRIYADALGGSRAARATWQAVDQRAGAPWGRRSASQGVAFPKVASMRRCERGKHHSRHVYSSYTYQNPASRPCPLSWG